MIKKYLNNTSVGDRSDVRQIKYENMQVTGGLFVYVAISKIQCSATKWLCSYETVPQVVAGNVEVYG